MTFDWSDFLAPLDWLTLLMAAILGLALGWILRATAHQPSYAALFWQLAGGAIFFIPLSILRGIQGSDIWERLAATLVLWVIFVFAISATSHGRFG